MQAMHALVRLYVSFVSMWTLVYTYVCEHLCVCLSVQVFVCLYPCVRACYKPVSIYIRECFERVWVTICNFFL